MLKDTQTKLDQQQPQKQHNQLYNNSDRREGGRESWRGRGR